MEWTAVGEFKMRDKLTKERLGQVRVRRSDTNLVELGIFMGEPEIEIEIEPDIALAIADLLMDAAAPPVK